MRRGLKPDEAMRLLGDSSPPRARPPMRRGLKLADAFDAAQPSDWAARAAPYEKGTET